MLRHTSDPAPLITTLAIYCKRSLIGQATEYEVAYQEAVYGLLQLLQARRHLSCTFAAIENAGQYPPLLDVLKVDHGIEDGVGGRWATGDE